MNSVELRRLAVVVCAAAAAVLVATLIVVTLEVTAGGDSGPRVGDHWHAPYSVIVCGQRHPAIAEFPHSSGIHTHGDGIMHLHPRTPQGEGGGASVGQFFKNSGGWVDPALTPEGCTIDYSHPIVLRGDSGIHPLGQGFADASAGCDGKQDSEFERVDAGYVPRDGDCIRIVFGPVLGE